MKFTTLLEAIGGIKIASGAGAGKVWTSDATGVGSWATASSGGGSGPSSADYLDNFNDLNNWAGDLSSFQIVSGKLRLTTAALDNTQKWIYFSAQQLIDGYAEIKVDQLVSNAGYFGLTYCTVAGDYKTVVLHWDVNLGYQSGANNNIYVNGAPSTGSAATGTSTVSVAAGASTWYRMAIVGDRIVCVAFTVDPNTNPDATPTAYAKIALAETGFSKLYAAGVPKFFGITVQEGQQALEIDYFRLRGGNIGQRGISGASTSITALGNMGANVTFDAASAPVSEATGTLNANCVLTIANMPSPGSSRLLLTNSGTYTLSIAHTSGATTLIPIPSNATFAIELNYDGTNLYVSVVGGSGGSPSAFADDFSTDGFASGNWTKALSTGTAQTISGGTLHSGGTANEMSAIAIGKYSADQRVVCKYTPSSAGARDFSLLARLTATGGLWLALNGGALTLKDFNGPTGGSVSAVTPTVTIVSGQPFWLVIEAIGTSVKGEFWNVNPLTRADTDKPAYVTWALDSSGVTVAPAYGRAGVRLNSCPAGDVVDDFYLYNLDRV